MANSGAALTDAYQRFLLHSQFEVLGLMVIGSRAWGEAISVSDFDTRLIVRSREPYAVFHEPQWTPPPDIPTLSLAWADLNHAADQGVTFGLTNLAYDERCAAAGYFPLNDHTGLFQGRILFDTEDAVQRFRDRHLGVRFANVAGDYRRQTAWRVEGRLESELEALSHGDGLERAKWAIPALHTCCRIAREVACIASYEAQVIYPSDRQAIERYFAANFQWFVPTLQNLWAYKTDEAQRRAIFERAERREPECQRELRHFVEETKLLWVQFNTIPPAAFARPSLPSR